MSDEIRKDDEMDNDNDSDRIDTDESIEGVGPGEAADRTPPPSDPPLATGGDDPTTSGMHRRDGVKALATVPFVGALGYQARTTSATRSGKRSRSSSNHRRSPRKPSAGAARRSASGSSGTAARASHWSAASVSRTRTGSRSGERRWPRTRKTAGCRSGSLSRT